MTNTTLKIPSKLITLYEHIAEDLKSSEIDFITFRKLITNRLAFEIERMNFPNNDLSKVAEHSMQSDIVRLRFYHSEIETHFYADVSWRLAMVKNPERDAMLVKLYEGLDFITQHYDNTFTCEML